MFLPKGFLLEDEDLPPDCGLPATLGAAAQPSSLDHLPSAASPSASSVRGKATPGLDASDDAEEAATPVSTTNMRAKMLQQRQMMLAKQRQGPLAARNAVQATAGPCNPSPPAAAPCLNRAFSPVDMAQEEEEDERRAVMPEAVDDCNEEERARRRAGLIEQLNHRGISQEYDPTRQQDKEGKSAWTMQEVIMGGLRAFLHAPVPKEAGILLCRITRNRTGIHNKLHPKYSMETDDGVFLMTAQKQMKNKSAYYVVSSLRIPTHSGDEASFVGKLRSDFLGLEWTAYGPGLNPLKADESMIHSVREELLAVQYVASAWGTSTRGPQQMSVVIPRVQPSGDRLVCRTMTPQSDGLLALQRLPETGRFIQRYRNKQPKWHEQRGAFVLNFNNRVTMASVKNFQLVDAENPELIYLQFGRVGKDAFNLDFQHPLSPFQAFTLCLSCFDYKLGCA